VARLAAARDGVVSVHQLRTCGLDDHAIARRVRDGGLHRLYRGVYAVGHPGLTLRGRFRAAVLACGDNAVLSHFAAAVVWGFWAWDDGLIDVTIASGTRDIEGVRVHRSRTLERDVRVRHGIRVTSPARTLLDLAAVLPDGRYAASPGARRRSEPCRFARSSNCSNGPTAITAPNDCAW